MTSLMNKVSAAHFNHALLPSPHLSYYFLWPWEESSAGFDFPPFAASLPSFLIIEPNFLLWAFFSDIWWGSSGIFWVPGVSKRWWQWSGRKKAERLFHFESHFLPGHDGSVQEMLLSASAINCLLYDSVANTGLEWEGELRWQKMQELLFWCMQRPVLVEWTTFPLIESAYCSISSSSLQNSAHDFCYK